MKAMEQLAATLDATRIPGQCTLCGVKRSRHAGWCPRIGTGIPPKDQPIPRAPMPYLRWEIKRNPHAPRPRRYR